MLSTDDMQAVHRMIEQENPLIGGLFPLVRGQAAEGFDYVPTQALQLLHTQEILHFVAATTFGNPPHVSVFDSLFLHPTRSLQRQLLQLFCRPAQPFLLVRYVPFQRQVDGRDCGLFGAAAVIELHRGASPAELSTISWDQSQMRPHFVKMLESGRTSVFPRSAVAVQRTILSDKWFALMPGRIFGPFDSSDHAQSAAQERQLPVGPEQPQHQPSSLSQEQQRKHNDAQSDMVICRDHDDERDPQTPATHQLNSGSKSDDSVVVMQPPTSTSNLNADDHNAALRTLRHTPSTVHTAQPTTDMTAKTPTKSPPQSQPKQSLHEQTLGLVGKHSDSSAGAAGSHVTSSSADNATNKRRWIAVTGDGATRAKLDDALAQHRTHVMYIPGGLHWHMVHTRLVNSLIFDVLGNEAVGQMQLSENAIKMLTNCTNTHKATEFTYHWLLGVLRERVYLFVESAGRDPSVCAECRVAFLELKEAKKETDSQWAKKLRTSLQTACDAVVNSRSLTANASEQSGIAAPDRSTASAAKHQQFDKFLRSSRRRQLARNTGHKPQSTPLEQAIDRHLENSTEIEPLSDAHVIALRQLISCPHNCCSATRALLNGQLSTDAVLRNLSFLADRVASVVIAEQHAIRFHDTELLHASRRVLAPLLFSRGHTIYDAGALLDFVSYQSLTPGARQYRDAYECINGSSAAGQYQAIDGVGEEIGARIKFEPGPSDSDRHWDRRFATFDENGGLRGALNRSLGVSDRPRRPHTASPIESTVVALETPLRSLLQPARRKTPINLKGQPLALTVEQLHEIGVKRLQTFATERLIEKTIPMSAVRASGDTAKVSVSASASGPTTDTAAHRTQSARSRNDTDDERDADFMRNSSIDMSSAVEQSDDIRRSRYKKKQKQRAMIETISSMDELDQWFD
jgi:hypothetical protein